MARKKTGLERLTSFDASEITSLSKSYTSLIYGIVTVIIIFVILFFGIRAISQRQASITPQAEETSAAREYEVKEGDSLWSIAQKEYNDGYMWSDIARENKIANPNEIEKGMKLILPPEESVAVIEPDAVAIEVKLTPTPTPQTGMIEAQDKKITGTSYKVIEDDNLWDISVRAYGDGYKWVELAKENKIIIADLIYPDDTIKLPR